MNRQIATLSAATLVWVLAACGNQNGSTQVAAKVNSGEVTVHQVNYELGVAAGKNPSVNADNAARPLLEKLINQELLLQKAQEQKLDRNPNIILAMERAKRQVLAQAYLENIYNTLTPPSDQQIASFFEKNPLLFTERRFFQLQQFAFPSDADSDLITKKVEGSKNINEFTDWLKKDKVPVRAQSLTSPSERIPMAFLPVLAKIEDGKGIVMLRPQGTLVVWRLASKSMPLNFEQAKPFIQQFLVKSVRDKRANEEISALRKAAHVQYLGSFAGTTGAAADEGLLRDGVVAPEENTEEPGDNIMDKGVSGLK
ncbi:MAG: EpsD family peptidyl-prolyl cis-trans isomerase [Gammaproteobacteria bacterium]|nr:EpsD family peptidyl-prolyl cis-trans isomerase [Gammaproteobacteria bacterium]